MFEWVFTIALFSFLVVAFLMVVLFWVGIVVSFWNAR